MIRITPRIVTCLALAATPSAFAQTGNEIPGIQVYQDWYAGYAPGAFGDLETGAFSDTVSIDAIGQKGSKLLYFGKPERFWWITEVADPIVDFTVVPGMAADGTDAILASPTIGSGLERYTWIPGGAGFEVETVLDATWVGATHLDSAADRVWAIDASGSFLLRATHDGNSLTADTPIFIGGGVLDVVAFDYDGVDGDELAIHFDIGWLAIISWDGDLLFSIVSTNQDHIVASRAQSAERDMLLWWTYDPGVLDYRIFPFHEGQAYDPIDLEAQTIHELIAFDLGDPDGEDLVVLSDTADMLVYERVPVTGTAAFDSAPRPVEFGGINWGPAVPADDGVYADFDGDGDQDLFLVGGGVTEHARLWLNDDDEWASEVKPHSPEAAVVIDTDSPGPDLAAFTVDVELPTKTGIIGSQSRLLFEVWLRPDYTSEIETVRRLRHVVDVSGYAEGTVLEDIPLDVDVTDLTAPHLAVFEVLITLVDADAQEVVIDRHAAFVGRISADEATQDLLEGEPNPFNGLGLPSNNGTGLSQSGQSGNQQPPGGGPRTPSN